LKHAISTRSAAAVKASPEAQVTDAERLLIRALASATQMQSSEEHISARDGAEEDFDPARQAHFVLRAEQLHLGLATEALIELLLDSSSEVSDVMELPLSQADRNLLAAILMNEEEELSAERLEGAARALRRIQFRRSLETVQHQLRDTRGLEAAQVQALLHEKMRLKRALMDQGPGENPGNRDPSLADGRKKAV